MLIAIRAKLRAARGSCSRSQLQTGTNGSRAGTEPSVEIACEAWGAATTADGDPPKASSR
jgi:hypothetical protein